MTAVEEEPTVAPERDWTVREPGVVDGMPEDVYHADPVPAGALSCSGAKKLLPPSCPALFKHQLDHGQPHKAFFDFGRAAHKEILGAGGPTVVIDAPDWRSKAAQTARADAYAAGMTPLLTEEHERIVAMAATIKAHPIAGALFDPTTGKAEQSLFYRDPDSGVMLRSRLDWLPDPLPGRPMRLVDYKTCASAEPGEISRSMAKYAYAMQAAWYRTMVLGLGLASAVEFVFAFQEKTPPYLVTVVEPDTEALQVGERMMRRAIDTYVECTRTGVWPGYTAGIELVGLPFWAVADYDVDVAV